MDITRGSGHNWLQRICYWVHMNRHQIIIPEILNGRELLGFPYSDEAADDEMNSNSELSKQAYENLRGGQEIKINRIYTGHN